MPFQFHFIHQSEIIQADQFGANGRTILHDPGDIKMTGADRQNVQAFVVSNGVTLMELPINPLGSSAPSNTVLVFLADQPVDLKFGDSGFASGVLFAAKTGILSGLFITTGTLATTVKVMTFGGSNASIITNLPLP